MADNKGLNEEIYAGSDLEEEIEIDNEGGAKIQSMEDATRFAYGLHSTREEIAKLEDIAAKEIEKWQAKIDQVTAWRDSVVAPLKNKEGYLADTLKFYHVNQYNAATTDKEKKKFNSIKLPYDVTLKSRAQADKLEVADEVAYLKYAEENKLIKKVEPAVDWATMKKSIVVNSEGKALSKESGEFLDFISVVPQERKFEVS